MTFELSAYRAQFPITAQFAYLNHAGIAPLPTRAAKALHDHIALAQTIPFDRMLGELGRLGAETRARAAQLLNAPHPEDIVLMPNTATGINTIANSLPLRAGDNVLVLDGDYPAMIYPWLNLAPRGVLVKWVPQVNGGLDMARLEARVDARTRVIAISSAMFATGFKNDIAAAGALCQARGIYFVVDAIQTLGAFPLDVQACHVDFLACGSQKWLLGAPGSGLLYCRRERLPELQPGAYVGASSTVDPFNYLDYNFTLLSGADRFNLGTPNILGQVALHAALDLLLEVGSETLVARILAVTDTLIADLQARGYRILSNLRTEHRSGIVIVEHPDPQAACKQLLDANVVAAARGGLRLAPHFYNNDDDVLRVGEVLGNA
jgi:selenocysteine lyase/cysteine desulfurase